MGDLEDVDIADDVFIQTPSPTPTVKPLSLALHPGTHCFAQSLQKTADSIQGVWIATWGSHVNGGCNAEASTAASSERSSISLSTSADSERLVGAYGASQGPADERNDQKPIPRVLFCPDEPLPLEDADV